jgi:hypothetical protein
MFVSTALRPVAPIRYVMPLREGGSLPGLVEADDDGLYVIKFRGAGQGLPALVAEVIVGELARRLGLLVPELRRARPRDPAPDHRQRRLEPRCRLPAGRASVHARGTVA